MTFNNAANTPVTCSDGLIDSTLTAGRVTLAGASGRLSDDADLTFATDTLSATKVTVATTLTSPNLVSAAGVTEAISATAPPVPANGTTAGSAVTITASAAVPNAGAGTDGAAAGGSITLTAGAAARDTSGNANGGDITLAPGVGVGTGTKGGVIIPDTYSLHLGDSGTGGTFITGTGTGILEFRHNSITRWGWYSDKLSLWNGAAFGISATGAGSEDVGLARSSAGVLKVTNGSTGNGALLVGAGTGTGQLNVGGVLCKGAPAQATTGTSEEILATCTIPANTLSASGSAVLFKFFAHTAANGNNKQLRVRIGGIGGTVVCDSTAVAANNLNITTPQNGTVARTGATTATAFCASWQFTNAASSATISTTVYSAQRAASITWGNANDLVFTGTTPTAAGDLTLDSYAVEVVQ